MNRTQTKKGLELGNFEQREVLNLNKKISNEVLIVQMSWMKAMKFKPFSLENIISSPNRIESSTKIMRKRKRLAVVKSRCMSFKK